MKTVDCCNICGLEISGHSNQDHEFVLTNFHVFNANGRYPHLDDVAEGESERDRILAYHKATYPSIPVYWHEVQEAEPRVRED